ncbi:site-specific integrase [Brachybacterium sp. SGAir0954]|uniref:tyrosine-type recombinase/integrase n=1 Tax=Brachybacterium sp. SGAir0954 TaxID=2571029 RepID=UPI00143DEA59|nr:site-specific integrase [Brachybacterium sp. SGAir0954]
MGTTDGSRVVSRIAPTHSEAADATRAAVQVLVDSLSVDPKAPTLGSMLEWVRARIDAGDDPNVTSPRSRGQYLAVLATWCGLGPQEGERTHHYRTDIITTPIADLTPGDLQDELVAIAAAGGASAMRHVRAMWRKSTARALALRLIVVDPASGLTLPPAPPRGTKVYANGAPRFVDNALTPEQEKDLREFLASDDRAKTEGIADPLALALETGARISELISIRWDDVSDETLTLAGQIVRIKGEGLQWRAGLKTGPETRVVPLTKGARTLLDRRRARRPEESEAAGSWLVFTSPRGMRPDPDNMAAAVRRALDRAGLPWATVHTLRRTVENRLISSGTDPRLIERVMGHTSVTAHRAYWNRGLDPVGALSGLEGSTHVQPE